MRHSTSKSAANNGPRVSLCAALPFALALACPPIAVATEQSSADLRGATEEVHAACDEVEGECVMLLGVSIDGASAVSRSELAQYYEPYLARPANMRDLARIAQTITDRYRAEGYFLSRAVVPPQELDGMARIVVLEGRISDLAIDGDGAAQAAGFFRGIDQAPIADLADLDHRVTLAKDSPGLEIHSHVEPDAEDLTRHRLVVTATRTRLEAFGAMDNRGSEAVGPLQAYGRVAMNSVFTDGDQASLALFATPADLDELTALEASYNYPLANGARLGVSIAASRAHDGADSTSHEVGGDSNSLAVRYEHPLVRRRGVGWWLGAAFDARHLENDWQGGGAYADDLRVARFSLRGYLNSEGRATSVFVQTSFGVDALGASGTSVFRRSRYDADAQFAKLNLHFSYYRDIGRYFGLYAAADAQWADGPLLLSEEFALGGAIYGRAYDIAEISGDHGAAGTMELRAGYDPNLGPVSLLQAYAFFDTGQVWNYHTPPGSDELSLSSAGLGVRLGVNNRVTASLEFARPLTRTPFNEGDKDWRQFFSLSASY